jgi:hypothetical protein
LPVNDTQTVRVAVLFRVDEQRVAMRIEDVFAVDAPLVTRRAIVVEGEGGDGPVGRTAR